MLSFRSILSWRPLSYLHILKWDESKVRREPSGTSTGGQFAKAGGPGSAYGTRPLPSEESVNRQVGTHYRRAYNQRAEAQRLENKEKAKALEEAESFAVREGGGVASFTAMQRLGHQGPMGGPTEYRPQGQGAFQNVPRAEGFDPAQLRQDVEATPDPALVSGTPKSASVLGDSSNANASYLVEMEDGTKAVFKPEAGEAWNLQFTNRDIRQAITNRDFSLAEREAMASEISKGLGFGELVPETHLRTALVLPDVDFSNVDDDDSSGGYDTDYAREQYEEYKQNIIDRGDYYDEVGEAMEQLYQDAKKEHADDIENRAQEMLDIWNELAEDFPDDDKYGDVEDLKKHPKLPLGSAQSFHRQTKQGVVDPLEILDEAKVDPSAKMSDDEKKRVREVLHQRLKDGYQEFGDIDPDVAKEHLDRDDWIEEHQDTESRLMDSAIQRNVQSYTEWRHDQGMYTESSGGSMRSRNPNAPHPQGGSLQRFIENLDEYGSLSPEDATKMAVLDYALGSMDRHHKNIMYDDDRAVAIDNGYSMPNSNNVYFRSEPAKKWMEMGESYSLSESYRQPVLDALNATDWEAMMERHPNMNVNEKQAFRDRIGRLKAALATEGGLRQLWNSQKTM